MKLVISKDRYVFLALWVPTLNVIKEILEKDSLENSALSKSPTSEKMTHDTRELTKEHLRNVILVLSSFCVVKGASEEYTDESISGQTWSLIEEMGYCKK